ncbi:hypothetical protein P4O66_021203 [Electrophorus voltai]|uniref:Uncharacterized protein n=1 Tax=Electrophorus voltai TaxID=2609070 RepID=A0AAD8ZPM4_9TELE|nr:hypothetical protein P4O66_021203 [Electrophorus voltai]
MCKLSIHLVYATPQNLGLLFDCSLSSEPHIKSLVKNAFIHFRSIARLRSMLSKQDTDTLVHGFITSCPDYGNFLFIGINPYDPNSRSLTLAPCP